MCRLWPAEGLCPQELNAVTDAAISCLVRQEMKVIWAAGAVKCEDGAVKCEDGQWVSASEACFLAPGDKLSNTLIKVGRCAGLLIADVPESILQVSAVLHPSTSAQSEQGSKNLIMSS